MYMEATDGPTSNGFVYKVVLTGGPCAGKTTTLVRLRTFFENLGWKVYTVPEAATILFGSGIKWAELSPTQVKSFQTNIFLTILQIEKTIFELAERDKGNVLVVCDRGAMDPSAFCSEEEWLEMLKPMQLDVVQLRDERYDQIIHMLTSASGAEQFYQLTNNTVRTEGLELARELDGRAAQAWVGHPYFDVVDNSSDFETKIRRVIEAVCKRLGKRGVLLEVKDRLQAMSKKRKFLVKSLPELQMFPKVQDFDVQHDYLISTTDTQYRIRKRGQRGLYMYTLTDRKVVDGKKVESVRHLAQREYETLYRQRDPTRMSVLKTRRCFLWNRHYYQLDIYREPCTDRCQGLLLLETYTTNLTGELELPTFLEVVREVTSETEYSMFHLSDTRSS